MPKAVDIYVLQKKIGSGQFGDVFKGYSKVDGTQVAIKTIRRDRVKGKFTQLLDNEIQVLKTCKNNNIIRLIDIKKTANNIYLVLEFCNEGDLAQLIKQKGAGAKTSSQQAYHLPEQQAVEYFVQILHAFETLVKSKIMHRDFKLPNVLKHDGVLKVADFGFAKLLQDEDQQAETILGSPLNMAPQVLDHKPYNNKADIWSIGVAFYELVFGKVPYTANNIIDLLKKIRNQPLSFPRKVHPHIEDVLLRMLVVDPVKRIEWTDLFNHPINKMLQDQLQENLKQSLLCNKNQLAINMSKFYIKNNRVIDSTNQLFMKQELNHYVKNVVVEEGEEEGKGQKSKAVNNIDNTNKGKQNIKQESLKNLQKKAVTQPVTTSSPIKYSGPLIKRKHQRQNKENINQTATDNDDDMTNSKDTKTQKIIEQEIEGQLEGDRTQMQLLSSNNPKKHSDHSHSRFNQKINAQRILHERNKYAFFGHLAQEALQLNDNKYASCLAFLLIKRVVETMNILMSRIKSRKLQNITNWADFQVSDEFTRLMSFLSEQEQVFNKFYEKLSLKVLEQGTLSMFEQQMMISGKFTREQTNARVYQNVLREYLKLLTSSNTLNSSKDICIITSTSAKKNRAIHIHVIKLIDGNSIDEWAGDSQYDFNSYYSSTASMSEKQLAKQANQMVQNWKVSTVC